MKKPINVSTREGVVLGGPARSVRAIYGGPSQILDPESRDLTLLLKSKGQQIDSVLQYVPLDVSNALSAIFIITNDRVIAIEVSSDI